MDFCNVKQAPFGFQGIYTGRDSGLRSNAFLCSVDYYDSVDPAPKTGWKAYVPTAVRYVLALVLLVVLDAFWMGLIAPLLGIKYFDIVEGIQVPGTVTSMSHHHSLLIEDITALPSIYVCLDKSLQT